MKQIVIINRYYPPNPAISGHSACEMVKALSHRNKDLRFLVRYIHAPYAGGLSSQVSAGILGGMTSIYNGKNKILRFLGNFVEGYRLVRLSLPYADAIISLTDPPMLNYWAGRLCKKQRIPWIYWSLDLYPDAFASAGIVSNKNIFYQRFQHAIKLNPPDFLIALGAQQAAYIKSKFKKNIPFVRLPCGIIQPKKSLIPPEWYSDNKTVFAYVGNMGEAHDPEFLTQLIFHMDPTRHICLLSLYGAKSNHVLSSVANHPAVRIIDHIPQEHLAYIDIHLVSLLPEWTHVCVPSKAVSAICSGKAIAFQGHRHSDTWKMFKSAAFYIERSHHPQKMQKDLNNLLYVSKSSAILRNKCSQAILYRNSLFDIKTDAYDRIASYLHRI